MKAAPHLNSNKDVSNILAQLMNNGARRRGVGVGGGGEARMQCTMNPLIHPRKFYKVTVTTLSGIFATKRADPYILHDRRYTSMHLLFYERLVCTCHSKGVLVTAA